MRLTLHTDYALRALILLASAGQQGSTALEIASRHGVSANHMQKILQRLRALGFVETVRGRGGGVRLARPAGDIVIGDVVRGCEPELSPAECFNPAGSLCRLTGACRLKGVLAEALAAYLAVLDRYTLSDVAANRALIAELLGLEPQA